jgi:hypothetical protein
VQRYSGTISGNTANDGGGGVQVYLSSSKSMSYEDGKFTKTGGTIDGTNNARNGKIVFVDGYATFARNSTAGPSVNLDSSVSGRQGGWE